MKYEGATSFIVIIIWIIAMAVGIYARIYKHQKQKERIQRYVANITSQTRPLIIYHVPVSSNRETASFANHVT
jgi:L-lactate permease